MLAGCLVCETLAEGSKVLAVTARTFGLAGSGGLFHGFVSGGILLSRFGLIFLNHSAKFSVSKELATEVAKQKGRNDASHLKPPSFLFDR